MFDINVFKLTLVVGTYNSFYNLSLVSIVSLGDSLEQTFLPYLLAIPPAVIARTIFDWLGAIIIPLLVKVSSFTYSLNSSSNNNPVGSFVAEHIGLYSDSNEVLTKSRLFRDKSYNSFPAIAVTSDVSWATSYISNMSFWTSLKSLRTPGTTLLLMISELQLFSCHFSFVKKS